MLARMLNIMVMKNCEDNERFVDIASEALREFADHNVECGGEVAEEYLCKNGAKIRMIYGHDSLGE